MKKKRLLGLLLWAAVLALLFAAFRSFPISSQLEENALEACSVVLVKTGVWDISPAEAGPEDKEALLEILSTLRVRWGGFDNGIATRPGERLYTLALRGVRGNQEVYLGDFRINESGHICVSGRRYIGETDELIAQLQKICASAQP